jgi:integrase
VKLLPFLFAFWNAKHPYFEEMEITRSRKPSAKYIRTNADILRLHVEPFAPFQGITVNAVKAPLLRDWVLYLAHKGASKSLIKSCRQTISVPLSYLVTREELEYNPMERVKPPCVERIEKGIFSSGELTAIAHAAGIGAKTRLTTLLGALCGMRIGEICGLRWENITDTTININIQWQDGRGLLPPKYGSSRTVPVPSDVAALFDSIGRKESGFVFPGQDGKNHISAKSVYGLFFRALYIIGIGAEERERRNITFHSTRHTFVTLCRMEAGVSDLEIQTLAGHRIAAPMESYSRGKSGGIMMAHYSHGNQAIDLEACRRKIETLIGRNAA